MSLHERLKYCWSLLAIDLYRLLVQASTDLLFQNKHTDGALSPEMAKEKLSQAQATTSSQFPRLFETSLHWNDIRNAQKVWTKKLDEHWVLVCVQVWEKWFACRYELDPCLSHIFGSQKGTELQALQRSRCLAWIGHTHQHGDFKGVTSRRWRLHSRGNKIFAFELQLPKH